MSFKLVSKNKPAGDQINAIKELTQGLNQGKKHQVLLGATGTGKTFTIANVIANINQPTIVLSHNKTLASQLYTELKQLFPNNHVEYFISNFDYYRPEAYMPTTDTYIDKTSKSNWDIEAMRMSALNALLTHKDTIVVASVAAIYGQLSPQEYVASFMKIFVGQKIKRTDLLMELVKRNYKRNDIELGMATFRARGDNIELSPSWTQDFYLRISLFDEQIESISEIDTLTGEVLKRQKSRLIYPGTAYTTRPETIERAIATIKTELSERLQELNTQNKLLEHQRLEQRTNFDLESLNEFGTCSGIENYSRHLEGRAANERPFTTLDYFPNNALMVIDESHMMIPQLNAMYNGDRSRKSTLVEYGFRLPSALDNRPLKFVEFEKFKFQRIYVSATPSDYELNQVNHHVVSQIVRPTGLLDPEIEIVPTINQVEDIFNRIQQQKVKQERTFILTVTKRMAEELSRYLKERNEKVAYIHSDHKTFERDEILRKFRKGVYDTVVGVNLIREGIDIPEVSLICVLDADKESFFRSTKSLIQMIGRSARNVNGRVIFYGDKITESMKNAIEETDRRREIQRAYNLKHKIIPQTIIKPIPEPIHGQSIENAIEEFMTKKRDKNKREQKELINDLRRQMLQASKDLNFERAAQLRDIIIELEVDIN